MIVSLFGLVISLFAYLIAFPQPHQRRFDIYALILVVHIIGAIAFWLLSFESAMDAFTYYRDPFNFIQKNPFESGTYLIVHLVQWIKRNLGGSFLDHFLFFQCFGMIGIALLLRSLNEIADSFGMTIPIHVYLTMLLPGLHFWSAGIGKDGLMIMAVSLSLWAAVRIQKRVGWMGLSILIMAFVRPHVGAIVIVGITVGLLFSRHLSGKSRIMLAPVALMGLVYLVARATAHFGVSLDQESLTSFFEQQQDFGEQYGGGADLRSLPLPLKIFTLMFRPFFFDVSSWLHRAASIENAILLYICAYLFYHWKVVLTLARNVFFMTYSIVFSVTLIVLLSMVSYNIGLGQRQKMMVVPAILLLYGTVYIYRRYLANAAQAAPPVHAGPTGDDVAVGAAYGPVAS